MKSYSLVSIKAPGKTFPNPKNNKDNKNMS